MSSHRDHSTSSSSASSSNSSSASACADSIFHVNIAGIDLPISKRFLSPANYERHPYSSSAASAASSSAFASEMSALYGDDWKCLSGIQRHQRLLTLLNPKAIKQRTAIVSSSASASSSVGRLQNPQSDTELIQSEYRFLELSDEEEISERMRVLQQISVLEKRIEQQGLVGTLSAREELSELRTHLWARDLARSYAQLLFKEYALISLERYELQQYGLRWRTSEDVWSGKGQWICGEISCDKSNENLHSFELPFGYIQNGKAMKTLVKVRLCKQCAVKLHWGKFKKEQQKEKSKYEQKSKSKSKKRKIKEEEDGDSDKEENEKKQKKSKEKKRRRKQQRRRSHSSSSSSASSSASDSESDG